MNKEEKILKEAYFEKYNGKFSKQVIQYGWIAFKDKYADFDVAIKAIEKALVERDKLAKEKAIDFIDWFFERASEESYLKAVSAETGEKMYQIYLEDIKQQ